MHISKCCGLYIATCAAAFMGMSLLTLTVDSSSRQPLFHFAPSIVFFTVGMLAWMKVQDTLMRKGLRDEEATLVMTIPVAEEDIVLSKIIVGSIGNFLVYVVLFGMAIYGICFSQSVEYLFTMLSVTYIDLGYSAWIAASSIGLVPLLLFFQHCAFCGLLLWSYLHISGSKAGHRFSVGIGLALTLSQLALNRWIFFQYASWIEWIHPLLLSLIHI